MPAPDAIERQASDGVSVAADPVTDPATATHAAGTEEARGRPSGAGDSVAPDLPVANAGEIMGSEPGQVSEIIGFLSRRGSPGPIVPSHCAGDTLANNGERPGNSTGNDGNAGLAPPTLDGGPETHGTGESPTYDARSLPLDADCAGGVAAAGAQGDPGEDHTAAGNDLPFCTGTDHHGGSTSIKAEVDARPAPAGVGTGATASAGGEALPVPCDANDGDAHLDTDGSRPLEASTEAEDGLPSFSPDGAAPESPADPDGEQGAGGPIPPSPNGETHSISDGLSLLSLTGDARRITGQDEGARTPRSAAGATRRTREQRQPAYRLQGSSPPLQSRSSEAESGPQTGPTVPTV